MTLRIEPPLDPGLLRSLREYAEEHHPSNLEPEAPSLFCPWKPSPDGTRLFHTAYPSDIDADWLSYLIALFFACTGHTLSGEAEGITCTANIVTTHT